MFASAASVFWFVALTWFVSVEQEYVCFHHPVLNQSAELTAHSRPVLFVQILWHYIVCVVCADREADGVGAFGVSQHTQEAGVLSARSTGHRHREETCKKHSISLYHSFHSPGAPCGNTRLWTRLHTLCCRKLIIEARQQQATDSRSLSKPFTFCSKKDVSTEYNSYRN